MTDSSAPGVAKNSHSMADHFRRWITGRSKSALAVCAIVGICIFWFLSSAAGVPVGRRYEASLLVQPSVIVALMVAIVGLVGSSLAVGAIQGFADPQTAIFGAAAGLAVLSWRGGPIVTVLQNSSLSIFLGLTFELILLAAMLAGCWWIVLRLAGPNAEKRADEIDWNERWIAIGAGVATMAVCMYLFAQTDTKKQAMAAVGVSAFVAAVVMYGGFQLEETLGYLAPPIIVGVGGYLLAYFLPGQWHIGRSGQPLAYALPIDYASLGTVGALLGKWTAYQWKHDQL